MDRKCVGCLFMKLAGRAQRNAKNRWNPRGYCICTHPKAIVMFQKVCPKSNRAPGFIGFTKMGGCVPALKTSPRWCPLRAEQKE